MVAVAPVLNSIRVNRRAILAGSGARFASTIFFRSAKAIQVSSETIGRSAVRRPEYLERL